MTHLIWIVLKTTNDGVAVVANGEKKWYDIIESSEMEYGWNDKANDRSNVALICFPIKTVWDYSQYNQITTARRPHTY